jgi:Rrf2 family nitric oxide-sensitive transcriptional repressor
MRLTIRTNLAMRALMYCGVNAGRTVRKAEIAAACNASENHLGVVINLLAQSGFIETSRGRGGGIRLARPAEEICVGRVFLVFESSVPFAECFAGAENQCPLTLCCRLKTKLAGALEAFYAALDEVTLADLIDDNSGLEALLARQPA